MMRAELVVLGSGTLVPSRDRASAGFALRSGDAWIQMDLGRGVVQRLCEAGFEPLELRTLLLSHIHPDHCCDLVPLLFARNYAPDGPSGHVLDMVAPAGFQRFYEQLVRAWRWLDGASPLRIHESNGDVFDFGPFRVESFPLAHGKTPNLGDRIEVGERSMAYTGDTGPCDALLSLADGVDILISECAFSDDSARDVHLSPAPLARAASLAGVQKLVVTHVYPGADPESIHGALRREFGGEILMAHDGQRIEL